MSTNAAAVRVLERHEAEDLRPMLGLVTDDGDIPPDDTNVYVLRDPAAAPGARNPDTHTAIPTRPRDRSNVPEGLANLPPVAPPAPKRRGPKPKPKVIRPAKPREVPECGSYKAYARHRRRNEPIDDACRQAAREYGQTMTAEYRERRRKQAELKRLLDQGVSPAAAATLAELAR